MSNTERKRLLNYRTASGISPNPDNIDYGEIAIGYKKDSEAIYIKNTANDIVDFTPISIVNITYNELKNLRDNSNLKPSQYYRITDFVTTVANDPEARSAGHAFDIIVMASEKNKLQEECYAIQHEGDTYFANCNLAAWKIWYCLDNDNTKYMWADTTNGKGVIYRMIDELGNDCPYDFKNVQFKRYAVADASSNGALADLNGTYIGYNSKMNGLNIPNTEDFKWMYTFSLYKENEYIDYSSNYLHGPFTDDFGYVKVAKKGQCVYNTLSNTYGSVNIDGQFYISLILNNIVLISKIVVLDMGLDFPSEMVYNTFRTDNFNMTLKDSPENNKFGNKCYNNIVGGYANTFENNCYFNTFGDHCEKNTFGNECDSNSFGNYCQDNTFGNGCDSNSFGNYCFSNTFGNWCFSNTFGDWCESNSFGNYCESNTFGNNFQSNAIGNDVNYIEIPTEKIYNTQILNGTKGTDSNNKLTIEFTPETTYSQFAGLTSDGVLKIWVDADDPISIINITYNELKNLRDNSNLKPSQHYRITDFVTTVANDPEARSAGHPFDIIVMASEKNKLQEECYAVQHENDEYFANCNLAAWKIWYCLDNDTTKYAWADTANGKGVIYRMIDEWQNDCPYDFKNVQFKRYWANGVNTAKTGEPKNIILQGYYGTASNTDIFTEGVDTNDYLFCFTFTRLNNISMDYVKGSVIQSNVLDESIQTEGFVINVGNRCSNNILKPTETDLVVDTKKYITFILLNNVFITVKLDNPEAEVYLPSFDNTLGVSCVNNTFGSNVYGLLFLSRCVNNTFENFCYGNSFGNNCYSNSFGNNCNSNSFGNNCETNTFGDGCYDNTFGNNCGSNSFGNDCDGNSFGNGYNNSFGNECRSNSFGNDCNGNSFGNECNGNSFGNNCSNNSFGNHCYQNTFGNYCPSNTFGNECSSNTFGDSCYSNSFGNYFQDNALGNDVSHIEIPTEKIYYTQILNGTKGTPSKKLTIEFTPETTYSQFAGFTSNNVLKIWVEADAVDGGSY